MTQPFKARYVAATRKLNLACDAVYSAGRPRDLRFSECYTLAAPDVRAAYDQARRNRDALDHEAEMSGRCYHARASAMFEV